MYKNTLNVFYHITVVFFTAPLLLFIDSWTITEKSCMWLPHVTKHEAYFSFSHEYELTSLKMILSDNGKEVVILPDNRDGSCNI